MKILFFSPFADIWKHSEIEMSVFQELKDLECDITFARCNSLYDSFCSVMVTYGLSENSTSDSKVEVCKRCIKSKQFINFNLGSNDIDLEEFIDEKVIGQTENILSQITVSNWQSYSLDGLNIGAIGGYEFLINNKIDRMELSQDEFKRLLLHIKNVVLTYFAVQKILEVNNFDRIVLYDRLIPVNRIVSEIGERMGIPVYSIGAAGTPHKIHNRVLVTKDNDTRFNLIKSDEWNESKNYPLKIWQIFYAYNIIRKNYLGIGSQIYSMPKNYDSSNHLKKILENRSPKKAILILLSSPDEIFAYNVSARSKITIAPDNGESDFEWLGKVIEWFKLNEDYMLFIRPHPRGFPNKREEVQSENSLKLLKFLDTYKDYNNIFIDDPSKKISLYDYPKYVDLVLNSTSSAGIDFSLFNIPVVSHNLENFYAYPREFNIYIKNDINYIDRIQEFLKHRPSYTKSVLVYRWIFYRYYRINAPLSGIFSFIFLKKLFQYLKQIFVLYNFSFILYFSRSYFTISNSILLCRVNSKRKIGNTIVAGTKISYDEIGESKNSIMSLHFVQIEKVVVTFLNKILIR